MQLYKPYLDLLKPKIFFYKLDWPVGSRLAQAPAARLVVRQSPVKNDDCATLGGTL